MARQVSVREYQRQQRGPTHTAIGEMDAAGDADQANGHDVATVDPMTGLPVGASQDDESTARLKALGYGGAPPADAGFREYDVVDGEVRDWRRPDTTPDRGDVTQVHQVGEEPRFSGGGADDAQQQSMSLVPTDADFSGRLYREAPELANLAEKLIGEHGFLEDLENCDIRWYWKRKTGVSKGRVKIGFMKRASDLLGHFSGADFIGWLSATTARDGKFTDTQIEAAVFHQLLHVGQDEKGNWIFNPHDFEGFAAEVRAYGTWTSDLKLGGTAFVAAHQMGLFTEDEQDDEEDDDEAAGQAYIDAAGEEMERDIASGAYVPETTDDPLADHDL